MKSSNKKDELSSGRTKEIKMLNAGNWKIQISFFAYRCKKKENWKLHVVKLSLLAFASPRKDENSLLCSLFMRGNLRPSCSRIQKLFIASILQLANIEIKQNMAPNSLLNLKHLERVQKCSELNSNRLFAAIIDSRAINSKYSDEAKQKWSDAFPPISCAEYCFQNKKLVKKLRYR